MKQIISIQFQHWTLKPKKSAKKRDWHLTFSFRVPKGINLNSLRPTVPTSCNATKSKFMAHRLGKFTTANRYAMNRVSRKKSCATHTHTSRIEIIQAMIKMNQQKIALAVWVTWVHHSDIPVAKSLTIHPASWQARCMSLILCYARETVENRWNVMDCTHQSSCGCGMLWMWSWYTPGFVFRTTVSRLQPGVSLVSFKSKTSTFNAASKHIGNVRKPWIDNLFQNLSQPHHHVVCVCVCLGLCNAVKSTLGDFLYPIHLPAPQTRTRNVRLRSKMMIPSNIPSTNDDPFCSIQHPKLQSGMI